MGSLVCSYVVVAALLLSCIGSVTTQHQCTPEIRRQHISDESTKLYLELERQLVEGYRGVLDQLRAAFLTDALEEVTFQLELHVVNGVTSSTCELPETAAFCRVSSHVNYTLELCHTPLEFKYFSPSASTQAASRSTYVFATWATLVHGNWLSLVIVIITYQSTPEKIERYVPITFLLDKLACNPSQNSIECDIDDLFSWTKLYAEFGGIPDTWDRNQKGSTLLNSEAYDGFNGRDINDWISDTDTLLNLCLSEYVIVALSLALVVAKFFPVIHSQIVSRAISLEYQSFYWGAAVVSNVFVYGLVVFGGKGLTLYFLHEYHPPTVIVAAVLHVVIVGIFLAVSLFIAEKVKTTLPTIPSGLAKYIINISFCFISFFSCLCFSKRCKTKTLQVLVLFSFMTSLHHSAMQVIAMGFILLLNVPEAVTLSTLHILAILLFIILLHYMFMATADLGHLKSFQRTLRITLITIFFVVIFGGIMLITLVYMLVMFKLRPGGFAAVVSTLLPPAGLSLIGWFVKKKLLKSVTLNDSDVSSSASENNGCQLKEQLHSKSAV